MNSRVVNIKNKFLKATLFGYGYIFLILGIILGLAVLFIALISVSHTGYAAGKFVILLFILAGIILKALWIDIRPPEGRDLLPMEAPRLFDLINELRVQLKVPRIHKVKVTAEFNAGIVQYPRFGIFGFNENYLILGLPLMEALSLTQFKAILAHEMCHISKRHGQFSMWSYRMISSWQNLSDKFETDKGIVGWIFRPFFRKFVPYYIKISKGFSREHEFESDAFAANAISGVETARALLRSCIMTSSSRKYWEHIDQTAQSQDFPPSSIYLGYINHMRSSFALNDVQDQLNEVMLRQTLDLDSHPSLSDRLCALNFTYQQGQILDSKQVPIVFKETITNSSADVLLDADLLKQWHDGLVQTWDEDNKKRWYELRENYHKDVKRIQELVAKQNSETGLTHQEVWEKAKLEDNLKMVEDAIVDLKKSIENNYEKGSAKLILAKLLLQKNDPTGVEIMKEGMDLEPQFQSWATGHLVEYYEKLHDVQQLKDWYAKWVGFNEKDRLADIERKEVSISDKFVPFILEKEKVEEIKAKVAQTPEVHRAYLICKKLEHYPNKPVYLLVVEIKNKFVISQNYYSDFQTFFIRQVWPVHLFIAVQNADFIRKAKKITNALIYENKGAR